MRLALLALALAVAFGAALDARTAWDDWEVLDGNPALRTLARPWRFFTDPATVTPHTTVAGAQYRPLRTLAYALQLAAFGGRAWGFHLVSILLHAACAWAVARLTHALYGRGGWVAGAVWLLHPALAQNVLYLAAQGNLLCLLFAALAANRFLSWQRDGLLKDQLASLAFSLAAMLSYENGMLVPLLLVLVDVLARQTGAPARGRALWRHLPHWVLLGAFVLARQAVTLPVPRPPWWGGGWGASVLLQLRLWLEGWRLTVLPANQLPRTMPDDLPALFSPLAAVAFHAALAGVCLVALRSVRTRWIPVVVSWWYLSQGPTSNLIVANLGHPFAPRFLFLALLLPVVAVSAGAAATRRPRAWGAVLLAALALAVVADRRQAHIWKNVESLFSEVLRHDPGDFTANHNLGCFYLRTGEPSRGAAHLARASAGDPSDPKPVSFLGDAARLAGRPDQARAHYRQALALDRRFYVARVRLAELDLAARSFDNARAWLQPIADVRIANDYDQARLQLARAEIAAGVGACEEARVRLDDAIRLWPSIHRVWFEGGLILHACGDAERARELFRRAAETARDEYAGTVGDVLFFN